MKFNFFFLQEKIHVEIHVEKMETLASFAVSTGRIFNHKRKTEILVKASIIEFTKNPK